LATLSSLCFFATCLSCFLSCSAAPCLLHSFPTRRSSDLPVGRLVLIHSGSSFTLLVYHCSTAIPIVSRFHYEHTIFVPVYIRKRSEEHTSELQSRFDLVCRLLLEKKKKHDHTLMSPITQH